MQKEQTFKCAFCKGTGDNPYYHATCPVCKGGGKNQIVGPYMKCDECKGSGRKSGTTLTCFSCGGLGMTPDTREFLKQARKEMTEIKNEMEKEREELYGKVNPVAWVQEKHGTSQKTKTEKRKKEENLEEREDSKGTYYCQSCGKKGHKEASYKICEKCFLLYKFGELVRNEVKEEDNRN